jgi:hypothetical protein
MTREVPMDDSLIPSWMRQHAMILKLAMILSAMDNTEYTPESFVISLDHLKRAQQLSNFLHLHLPKFIALASRSDETKWIEVVSRFAQRAGRIQRFKLTQMCSSRGLDRVKMDFALEQLMLERKIGRSSTPGSLGLVYTWLGDNKRRMPKIVDDA